MKHKLTERPKFKPQTQDELVVQRALALLFLICAGVVLSVALTTGGIH